MDTTSVAHRPNVGEQTDHGGITPAETDGAPGAIRDHMQHLDAANHILELYAQLEQDLDRGEAPAMHVMGEHHHLLFTELIRDRPVFSLAWPADWYIPGDADYRTYWFTAPPAANRYRFGWAQSELHPTTPVLKGSASNGQVYVNTALLPSDTHDSAFAGVAALFRPSATLSYIDVSIDADITAHSRIWTLLAHPTFNLPTVHIRCTAYACVWHIDPVTNAWELIRPFGSRTLFNRSDSGLSGTPIYTNIEHFSANALATRVQVQAGHSYAVGFQAQVDIDADVRETSTQRYQKRDGDDWKLWADMACSASQITIASQVLIP